MLTSEKASWIHSMVQQPQFLFVSLISINITKGNSFLNSLDGKKKPFDMKQSRLVKEKHDNGRSHRLGKNHAK